MAEAGVRRWRKSGEGLRTESHSGGIIGFIEVSNCYEKKAASADREGPLCLR